MIDRVLSKDTNSVQAHPQEVFVDKCPEHLCQFAYGCGSAAVLRPSSPPASPVSVDESSPFRRDGEAFAPNTPTDSMTACVYLPFSGGVVRERFTCFLFLGF